MRARRTQALLLTLSLSASLAGCDSAVSPVDTTEQESASIARPATSPSRAAETGRFAPRDECSGVRGAAEFRERLGSIVERRDIDALAAIADADIALDFTGTKGIPELRERLIGPDADLWLELAELLPLGCAPDGRGGIIVPWVAGQDLGSVDPSVTWLVTAQDVPVHTKADASSPPIATISWTLVHVRSFEPDKSFQRVVVPGQDDGFIATGKLRSVFDYRLLAAPKAGQWRILALVAGN